MNDLTSYLINVSWTNKTGLYDAVLDSFIIKRKVHDPSISIVIISWQFNNQILQNFVSLNNQRYNNYELIFVNNGKDDEEFGGILEYVDTYIRLNTNTGAYKARNIGSVFANAPIIFFLEDDGVADEKLVESHLKAFDKYQVISVRGCCKGLTNNDYNKLAIHYYLGNKAFPYFANLEGNVSYKTKAFYAVGGWSDDISFGHGGPELSYRLTKLFPDKRMQIYSPSPIIYHDYVKSQDHLIVKQEKQKKSYQLLKEKYPDWNDFIRSWDRYFRKPHRVKRKRNNFLTRVQDEYYYVLEDLIKPLVRSIIK